MTWDRRRTGTPVRGERILVFGAGGGYGAVTLRNAGTRGITDPEIDNPTDLVHTIHEVWLAGNATGIDIAAVMVPPETTGSPPAGSVILRGTIGSTSIRRKLHAVFDEGMTFPSGNQLHVFASGAVTVVLSVTGRVFGNIKL